MELFSLIWLNLDYFLLFIADFSQLCSRLAVFRGEFWCVKIIETRDLFQVLFRYFKDTDLTEIQKSKQEIETNKSKQKSKYEVSHGTGYNSFSTFMFCVSWCE